MLLIIVKVMFTTSRARKKNKTSFNFRSKLTKAKREMVRNRKKIARGVVHRKSGRKFRVGPY